MKSEFKSLVDLIVRRKLEEFEKHYRMLNGNNGNVLWVSALVQCPHKWVFMLRYPEIAKAFLRGAFVLGDMVHRGLGLFVEEIFHELGYDWVEVEHELQKRLVVDGREVVLKGRADAVFYKGDDKVVYEFKTSRSDTGLPHPHHVLQLRIYMNMVGASRGVMLYLTPDRVAEYVVTEPLKDEELEELVREFFRFKGPRYEWECNYCPYAFMCPYKVSGRR